MIIELVVKVNLDFIMKTSLDEVYSDSIGGHHENLILLVE